MTLRPFSPLRYATNDRGGNGKNRSVAGVAELPPPGASGPDDLGLGAEVGVEIVEC